MRVLKPQRPSGSFQKLGGTSLGVPVTRLIVVGGLYWGPPILGGYHMHPLQIGRGLGTASLGLYQAEGSGSRIEGSRQTIC